MADGAHPDMLAFDLYLPSHIASDVWNLLLRQNALDCVAGGFLRLALDF
jgi:hypothetical protein